MLGDNGLNKTTVKAAECRQLVEEGKWELATNCWNQAEILVEAVNFRRREALALRRAL
jgi:hypothetical protein